MSDRIINITCLNPDCRKQFELVGNGENYGSFETKDGYILRYGYNTENLKCKFCQSENIIMTDVYKVKPSDYPKKK